MPAGSNTAFITRQGDRAMMMKIETGDLVIAKLSAAGYVTTNPTGKFRHAAACDRARGPAQPQHRGL